MVPVPNRLRSTETPKACRTAYPGPNQTAVSTFKRCCTGATFASPIGMTKMLLLTTPMAMIKAVVTNFFVFILFSPFQFDLLFLHLALS